jgi:DNA replication protein DnaC
MCYEEFIELLSVYAREILLQRSVTKPYLIDQHIGPVINQLYLYFTNNPECVWNLNAGLIFGGKIGCGKSILMMAYLNLSNEYSRRRTTMVHSKTLAGLIKRNGIEFYEKRPVFIDELGREESEVKDYGNVVKPVIDLFALRYEAGSRTYATTNFNYNSLEKFYGEFVRSRMEEMMTFVLIPGDSRRLKNEVKTK